MSIAVIIAIIISLSLSLLVLLGLNWSLQDSVERAKKRIWEHRAKVVDKMRKDGFI